MMLPSLLALLALGELFFTLSWASTSHTVQVGETGTFFDPPTLSAAANDTVTFIFSGAFHTVTQSSFETPCLPLQGGFNSGGAGTGANGTQPALRWTMVIKDDTQPIWYFCQATRPQSHCTAGMVGVINPPSISSYNDFLAGAKTETGTPTPSIAITLTGVGAAAANTPTPPLSTLSFVIPPASPAPSSSVISTPTPTPSTLRSSSRLSLGGAVGVAIGGTVALFLIVLLSYLLYETRRENRRRLELYNANLEAKQRGDGFKHTTHPISELPGQSGTLVSSSGLVGSRPLNNGNLPHWNWENRNSQHGEGSSIQINV